MQPICYRISRLSKLDGWGKLQVEVEGICIQSTYLFRFKIHDKHAVEWNVCLPRWSSVWSDKIPTSNYKQRRTISPNQQENFAASRQRLRCILIHILSGIMWPKFWPPFTRRLKYEERKRSVRIYSKRVCRNFWGRNVHAERITIKVCCVQI